MQTTRRLEGFLAGYELGDMKMKLNIHITSVDGEPFNGMMSFAHSIERIPTAEELAEEMYIGRPFVLNMQAETAWEQSE